MKTLQAALLTIFAAAASAQWVNYHTPGIPRTKDGKPDLSGVWHVQPNTRAEMKALFGEGVDAIRLQ